ncbi:DNA replication complex GINS protein [Dirofilaria immitis]
MERTKAIYTNVDKNYYDMKDILACKQSLRCLFSNPLPREIFQLIGQRTPDIEEGFCRADLPLFMIKVLPNCRVLPPAEFNPVQMQVLRAAPEHVDLMHLNQFYFILSKHIVKLVPNEDGRSLAETTLFSFLQRSGWILNCALHQGVKPRKIDSTEAQLYREAFICALKFSRWFNSRSIQYKTLECLFYGVC